MKGINIYLKLINFTKRLSKYIHIKNMEIISTKEKDISLNTDKILNRAIISYLEKESNYPILSEEEDNQKDYLDFESYYWIIDPLDGTLNFSKEIPFSCISIALWFKDKPILGIIYDFNRDEMFSGVIENNLGIESGAWLNEKPMKVSNTNIKSNAVLSTGFPSWRSYEDNSLNNFLTKVQEWKKIRLLGSAALSMAWVGSGRMDGYIEEDIRIWDIAAGAAIVKAAGGEISVIANERKNFVTAIATNGSINTKELF